MVVKTLSRSIRQYKLPSVLTPLFMTGEVLLECLIPLVMARLLDTFYGNSIAPIIKLGLILVAMAMVSLLCGTLSGLFASRASSGFSRNLRHDLFYKIQEFSFGNVDKFSSASLVTRLTVDVFNVKNAFMMLIRMAVRFPLMLIIALIMSFTISVKMTFVFLAIIPVLALGMTLLIVKVYPMFDGVFKRYDALNDSVQENIKGMRVVKTYVREEHEKQKFEHSAEDIRKTFTKAERIINLTNPLQWFCIFTAIVLVSTLGAIITVKTFGGYESNNNPVWGELSTGDIAALFTYIGQILSSLMMLAQVLVMIVMASASAKRIAAVLEEQSDIVSPQNALTEVKDGSIDFCGVNFKYSANAEADALENIDLHIKSGETVGIIGGTGSGKTSLVQLIPRLYDAYSGCVKVGGSDVREYDLQTLRNSVAMVLQKNLLFSGTIAQNLRWGDENATDEEIKRAAELACADEFVSSFPDGYDTHIEQGGTNVSGGQKQRLTIARALLKKPKILILDDSTSAVDTRTDALIRKAFREEIPGTTKIIIAQRTASVMDADRIVVLDNGRISAVGTHEQLLASNDIYREVYESQNRESEGGNE